MQEVMSRAEWHPDRAEWAMAWETVMHFRTKWIAYYLAKIKGDSKIMREEVCSLKEAVVRQYTEKEKKMLGGYDREEDRLMPKFSLMRYDAVDLWQVIAHKIFEYEGRGKWVGSTSEGDWVRSVRMTRRGHEDKGEAVVQMLTKKATRGMWQTSMRWANMKIENAIDYYSPKGKRAKRTKLAAEYERDRLWWVAMGRDPREKKQDWEQKDSALAQWWQTSAIRAVRLHSENGDMLPNWENASGETREFGYYLCHHKAWVKIGELAQKTLVGIMSKNLQRLDRATMREILIMNFRQLIDRGLSMTCTRFGLSGGRCNPFCIACMPCQEVEETKRMRDLVWNFKGEIWDLQEAAQASKSWMEAMGMQWAGDLRKYLGRDRKRNEATGWMQLHTHMIMRKERFRAKTIPTKFAYIMEEEPEALWVEREMEKARERRRKWELKVHVLNVEAEKERRDGTWTGKSWEVETGVLQGDWGGRRAGTTKNRWAGEHSGWEPQKAWDDGQGIWGDDWNWEVSHWEDENWGKWDKEADWSGWKERMGHNWEWWQREEGWGQWESGEGGQTRDDDYWDGSEYGSWE